MDEASLQVLSAGMADRELRANSKEKEMSTHGTDRTGVSAIYETCRVSDAKEKRWLKSENNEGSDWPAYSRNLDFLCSAPEGVTWARVS